jgi:hypothetical protein
MSLQISQDRRTVISPSTVLKEEAFQGERVWKV